MLIKHALVDKDKSEPSTDVEVIDGDPPVGIQLFIEGLQLLQYSLVVEGTP